MPDLFTHIHAKEYRAQLADGLAERWVRLLNDDDAILMRQIVDKVYMEYLDDICYPAWPDIFKAFNTLDYEDVRVVILGQDPYHNGNATGLAFACKLELSPSLEQIANAIMNDNPDQYKDRKPLHPKSDMSLRYLADQGVLLLNTALSVTQGSPDSHTKIWEPFTEIVIKTLNKRENLVWLLWGKHARSYKDSINPDHAILECSHPASAAYSKGVWVCDHFSKVNTILQQPITWF